jgi:aspartyl protease family protein
MVLWALRTVLLWSGLCYAGFVGWQNHDALFALAAAPKPPPAQAVGRPAANTVTFHPDRAGHFLLDPAVNGSKVRFLVDTGASYVTLTPEDARAAGIRTGDLRFSGRAATANGEVRVAPVVLREIRLGQFTMQDVDAVVVDTPLAISLLGMSFLKRLEGYEIRDGALIVSW